MKVLPNVLDRGFLKYQEEFERKALEVLRKGWYILGEEVKNFETEFAKYVGTKYAVGVANGLDALWIGMRLLGISSGDEVIVQANAYIACVMGITMNDGVPIFVEPDEYYNLDADKIEEKITSKTKAILVVHLYGQASNMEKIMEIAKKHNLLVIEDCAQSHGAMYNNEMTGIFGDIGCFSFYPSKNLGAFGDAGAIVTNNEKIAQDVRVYRNYGSEKRYYNKVVGTNSRLDELQAGLLRVRLNHFEEITKEREYLSKKYLDGINNKYIELPKVRGGATSVWHLFVIKTDYREKLMKYLEENEIYTQIHYPIPPYMSEAYEYLKIEENAYPITKKISESILSLPLYNGMTEEEIDYVIDIVNKFEI